MRLCACVALAFLGAPAFAQPPAPAGAPAGVNQPTFASLPPAPAEAARPGDRLSGLCEPAQTKGWNVSAGFDLMIVKPMFESNPAYLVQAITTLGPGLMQSSRRVEDFDYSLNANPRIWLAVSDAESGIGARVRWFGMDQSAPALNVVNTPIPASQPGTARIVTSMSPLLAIYVPTSFPGVASIQASGRPPIPDRLRFTTKFELNMWDFDATVGDLEFGPNWRATGFGGVRYMNVEHQYDVRSVGLVPQFLHTSHDFDGVGPTAGIELRRKLSGSGLSAYGAVRYSVLMGTANQTSSGLGLGIIPAAATGLTVINDRTHKRIVLPVIDLEVGVDWVRRFDPVDVFVRPAFVSFLFPNGSGTSGNGNMGVVGLSLSAGVKY